MTRPLDRVFMDTGFAIATYNRRDQLHQRARQIDSALADASEVWTTDAVLLEISAALAKPAARARAIQFWDQFHGQNPKFRSVEFSGSTATDAVNLYRERIDKSWSLTDCLSFVVMEQEKLNDALTTDRHFEQAGFRALLL